MITGTGAEAPTIFLPLEYISTEMEDGNPVYIALSFFHPLTVHFALAWLALYIKFRRLRLYRKLSFTYNCFHPYKLLMLPDHLFHVSLFTY
jgi:hypothetical protein